jgi:hypothetical protein
MRGRAIPLSAPRRFLSDLMSLASRVPTVPVQRRMQLAEVAAARGAAADRPGWPAVFIKAYARVAAQMPELRRAYICLPWHHLYEYQTSAATVAVEREYRGEKAVFFGRIDRPADADLTTIDGLVRAYAETPVEEVKPFRKLLWFARLPRSLRRLLLWLALNVRRSRPSMFGTFALSVYSSLGAESLHPISPQTTTLTYGVIQPDGWVNVRLIYDHRVMDGAVVARALARLEEELNGAICDELRAMARSGPRADQRAAA